MKFKIITFITTIFLSVNSFAQKDGFFYHKVAQYETLQDIVNLYSIDEDSVIFWNDLVVTKLKPQQLIEIKNDYQLINEEKFLLYQSKIDSLETQKQKNNEWLQDWIEDVKEKNFNVDMSDNNAIQIVFERAQRKSFLIDSIDNENKTLNKQIADFSKITNTYTLKKDKETKEAFLAEQKLTIVDSFAPTKEKEESQVERKASREKESKPKSVKNNLTKSDNIEVIIIDDTKVEKTEKIPQIKQKKDNEIKEDEIFANVKIKEVIINQEKKKKYKFGDVVDKQSQDKAKFYLTRAKNELEKENTKKAFSYIDKSLTINPSYVNAYILRGEIYASMKQHEIALDQFYKGFQLDSANAQSHYNIGICLIQLNRKGDALVAMNKAIELDSIYLLALYGRASLHLDLNNYQFALNDFNKILLLNKYFYPAMKGKGIVKINEGEYDDAIADLNNALSFDEKDGQTYFYRAMAYLYKDDLYQACIDFLKATELGYEPAIKNIKKYCE